MVRAPLGSGRDRGRLLGVAVVAAVVVMVGGAGGARAATVTEFSTGITPGSHPFGIAAGSDGNLWFTEPDGGRIGRITPSGAVTEFSSGITANSFPTGIAAGPDGNLWFTEPGTNAVGRITPTGTVTEFTAGITADSGPNAITAGPYGSLWFTERNGDRIGRITSAGTVTEFSTGTGGYPQGIAAGPDGNLWFAEGNLDAIGRITPTGALTEFTAGITAGSAPNGITVGPDGNLWFAEYRDRVARITPEDAPPPGDVPPLPAPLSNTGSVSEITATSATVSGSVNAQGSPTIAYFEYGTSAAYGSTKPGQTVTGTSTRAVNASLSGLKPATAYHYRLVADNAPGTTRGVDRVFTTRPLPDADGDGVPDSSDGCPSTAGRRRTSGCPANGFSLVGTARVEKLLTVLEVRVPGPGVVKARQAGARRRKPALIKALRVSATNAGRVKLRLEPSRAGRRLLRSKRTFSVKVKVTYTPRGGKPKSAVRRVAIRR